MTTTHELHERHEVHERHERHELRANGLCEHLAPALRALGLLGWRRTFSLPDETHWLLLGLVERPAADRVSFTFDLSVVRRTDWTAAALPGHRPDPRVRYGTRPGGPGSARCCRSARTSGAHRPLPGHPGPRAVDLPRQRVGKPQVGGGVTAITMTTVTRMTQRTALL